MLAGSAAPMRCRCNSALARLRPMSPYRQPLSPLTSSRSRCTPACTRGDASRAAVHCPGHNRGAEPSHRATASPGPERKRSLRSSECPRSGLGATGAPSLARAWTAHCAGGGWADPRRCGGPDRPLRAVASPLSSNCVATPPRYSGPGLGCGPWAKSVFGERARGGSPVTGTAYGGADLLAGRAWRAAAIGARPLCGYRRSRPGPGPGPPVRTLYRSVAGLQRAR